MELVAEVAAGSPVGSVCIGLAVLGDDPVSSSGIDSVSSNCIGLAVPKIVFRI